MASRTPITWKNIDAPDYKDAAVIRGIGAQQTMGAMDTLSSAAQSYDKAQGRIQTDNAEDFKSRLMAAYQTPDALIAAQQSGEVDALKARYENNGGLDRSMTDTASFNTLVEGSQQKVRTDQIFADERDKVADRGSLAGYAELIAQGDNKGARAALEADRASGKLSEVSYIDTLKSWDTENVKDIKAGRESRDYHDRKKKEQIAIANKLTDSRIENLSLNSDAASLEQLTQSGDVYEAQQANKALVNLRDAARNKAINAQLALGTPEALDIARTLINQQSLEAQTQNEGRLREETKVIEQKAYEDAVTIAKDDPSEENVARILNSPSYDEARDGPTVRKLELNRHIDEVVNETTENLYDLRKSQQSHIDNVKDFEKRYGIDFNKMTLDDATFQNATTEQILGYAAFAASNADKVPPNAPTNTQLVERLTEHFQNPEHGGLEFAEARKLADEAVSKINSTLSATPEMIQQRKQEVARIEENFANVQLIQDVKESMDAGSLLELMPEEVKKNFQEKEGEFKNATDEVAGWVNQGYIPKNAKAGINTDIIITKPLLEYAATTAGYKDGGLWGGDPTTVKDRLLDLFGEFYGPDQFKKLTEYKSEINQATGNTNYTDNPQNAIIGAGSFRPEEEIAQTAANAANRTDNAITRAAANIQATAPEPNEENSFSLKSIPKLNLIEDAPVIAENARKYDLTAKKIMESIKELGDSGDPLQREALRSKYVEVTQSAETARDFLKVEEAIQKAQDKVRQVENSNRGQGESPMIRRKAKEDLARLERERDAIVDRIK